MITYNLVLAFRHLKRHRLSTTLHIIGLTLGMTACVLIGLFLNYELSFDTYHKNAATTYRVNSVWIDSGNKSFHISTPLPLAEALRQESTGIQHIALLHPLPNITVDVTAEKRFYERHILVAEPSIVDVFNLEAISGDPTLVLAKPYQALLTEETAKKYFGDENPVGKVFKLKNNYEITVGGVVRDLPANTHVDASMFLSFVPNGEFLDHSLDGWTYVSGTETFIVLAPDENLSRIDTLLKRVADKHINSNPNVPKYSRSYFSIQPLTDIHLNAELGGGGPWRQSINPSWLWFFGSIGAAILLLACINFMNLSTAQAIQRAREVGVRKSVGAARGQLIVQFLIEAWVLIVFAGILSVSIAQLTLPMLNTLLDKGITFDLFDSPWVMTFLGGGIILTGLLAGLYPAWVISRFSPAKTLKASVSVGAEGSSTLLRKFLVVTQFSISAGLLIALILIAQQVSFLRSSTLGFDKDNVVTVDLGNTTNTNLFMSEIMNIPQVIDIACATATPSTEFHWRTGLSRISRDDPNRKHTALIIGDDHYLKLYGLKLVAGRNLTASDTNSISKAIPDDKKIIRSIVNETLVKTLGFESNDRAIGEKIWISFNSGLVEIIGVVEDFNTGPLHAAIDPAVITQGIQFGKQAGIKIEANADVPATITAIENVWKKIYPSGVFEFKFLDEQIDAFYKAEERLYALFKIFAGVAMFISCLGLWGLATFAAQQRTKELGIRKVLGASLKELVMLLSKDFVILIIGALLIASPLAYYFVSNWLKQFAFHIDIQWSVFVVAGAISFGITLITVSFQAFRAARANPIVALKNE